MDEIVWCYHLNETSSAVLSHGTIYWVCSSSKLKSVDEIVWCYHLNKTSLTLLSHGPICLVCSSGKFKSVDEILWCYHFNETSSAELSPHGSQYFLCSSFYKKNFWNFVKCFITLATFGSEGLQRELWNFIVTTIWPKLCSK